MAGFRRGVQISNERPMLGSLPPFLRGVLASLLLVLNTLFWCALAVACAPSSNWCCRSRPCGGASIRCSTASPRLDRLQQRLDAPDAATALGRRRARRPARERLVPGELQPPDLGRHLRAPAPAAAGRVPMLKFFLKQQLIYVPVIGLAWWALDFPFMRRHGKARCAASPRTARAGSRATRRACREVRAGAHQRDEFRRRHALHAGQARRPVFALSPPAQAEGRRAGDGAERHGRAIQLAGRRDHRLPGGRARRSGSSCAGGRRASSCGCAVADPGPISARATTPPTRHSGSSSSDGSGRAVGRERRRDRCAGPGTSCNGLPCCFAVNVCACHRRRRLTALGWHARAGAAGRRWQVAQGAGLRAAIPAWSRQLANSQFQGPLYLDSGGKRRSSTQGDV